MRTACALGYYFVDERNTGGTEGAALSSDVFAALADPTRRAILKLLGSRDMTAGELADHFPLAKSTLSEHFRVLKEAGLVVTERQGTTIVYSANVSALEEAIGVVIGLFGRRAKRGLQP